MASGYYIKQGGTVIPAATGAGQTGATGATGSTGATGATGAEGSAADMLTIVALGNRTGALDLSTFVAASRLFTVTATGNLTLAPAGMPTVTAGKGASFLVKITQDATGSRTLTLTGISVAYGLAPVLSTTAAAVDFLTFLWDGAVWNCLLSGQAMA